MKEFKISINFIDVLIVIFTFYILNDILTNEVNITGYNVAIIICAICGFVNSLKNVLKDTIDGFTNNESEEM